MAEEINPEIMQKYPYEYSFTDVNGETVKSTGKIWANSKEHAEQMQTDSLNAFEGIKDLHLTVSDPEPEQTTEQAEPTQPETATEPNTPTEG